MTTTPNYPAPWAWIPLDELTKGSNFPNSDDSAQSCASPITPHASPGCEVNLPVVRESCGSLDSPTGDEHFAPAANPALLEELIPDFSLQSQAKPVETTSQNDKPSPDGPASQGAPFGEEDTAIRDALPSLFPELTESLDDPQETYSRGPSYDVVDRPEDLVFLDFQWTDPPMDALPSPAHDSDFPGEFLLDLDETGQGTPSSRASVAATHSETQGSWMQRPASQPQAAIDSASSSHSSLQLLPRTPSLPTAATAGPPPEILRALLAGVFVGIFMSSLPRGASGVSLQRTSSRRPNRLQEQRLSTPPKEDDDVVFVESRPKRSYNLSAGASDDLYPVKRPRSSRANVLLTQLQFHDRDRAYTFNRATESWRNKHDGTILRDVRFDKTMKVEVRPGGLSGMPVLLSWDEEEGMFRGYDTAGADRLVGRHVVEKLMGNPCKSLEVDWPDLDGSL